MIIYYCDRCHKEIKNNSNKKFEIRKATSCFKDFYFSPRMDILLCSDCEKEFEEWLYPKKEDDSENNKI